MNKGKRLVAAAVAIALSGCSLGSTQDDTEVDTSFSDPAPDPFDFKSWRGCEGSTLDACVTQVSTTLEVDDMQMAYLRHRKPMLDVNGHASESGESATISGRSRGSYGGGNHFSGRLDFYFHIDSTGLINGAHITLPRTLRNATTDQDFDETGIYEALEIALGHGCDPLSRNDMYRFMFNNVVPRMHVGKETSSYSFGQASQSGLSATSFKLCGRTINMLESAGNDTDRIDSDNPHGSFDTLTLFL